MGNNGELNKQEESSDKLIFEARAIDGGLKIKIDPQASFQLVSWAIRLLNLELDNRTIAMQRQPKIVSPGSMISKLRNSQIFKKRI